MNNEETKKAKIPKASDQPRGIPRSARKRRLHEEAFLLRRKSDELADELLSEYGIDLRRSELLDPDDIRQDAVRRYREQRFDQPLPAHRTRERQDWLHMINEREPGWYGKLQRYLQGDDDDDDRRYAERMKAYILDARHSPKRAAHSRHGRRGSIN